MICKIKIPVFKEQTSELSDHFGFEEHGGEKNESIAENLVKT